MKIKDFRRVSTPGLKFGQDLEVNKRHTESYNMTSPPLNNAPPMISVIQWTPEINRPMTIPYRSIHLADKAYSKEFTRI